MQIRMVWPPSGSTSQKQTQKFNNIVIFDKNRSNHSSRLDLTDSASNTNNALAILTRIHKKKSSVENSMVALNALTNLTIQEI